MTSDELPGKISSVEMHDNKKRSLYFKVNQILLLSLKKKDTVL